MWCCGLDAKCYECAECKPENDSESVRKHLTGVAIGKAADAIAKGSGLAHGVVSRLVDDRVSVTDFFTVTQAPFVASMAGVEAMPVGVKTWVAFLGLARLGRGIDGQYREIELRRQSTLYINTV